MALHKCFEILGLVLGMTGTVFLWFWEPPRRIESFGIELEDGNILSDGRTVGQARKEIERERARAKILSRVGFALIGFGFLAQLIGLWIAG